MANEKKQYNQSKNEPNTKNRAQTRQMKSMDQWVHVTEWLLIETRYIVFYFFINDTIKLSCSPREDSNSKIDLCSKKWVLLYT